MGFRPRMQSSIEGIVPANDVRSLQFDQMAVDFWQVESQEGATGEYVSPDPRFVVLFDKATIALKEPDVKKFASCNVCFVPAGLPLSGRIENPGRFEHIDIHLDEAQLRRIAGTNAELNSVLFLSASSELRRLSALLADECQQPERPYGYSEALVMSMIHEIFYLGASKGRADGAPLWLKQVMEYVAGNLDMSMKVENLAALVNMSRSEFSKRFKELSGLSPHQWIMSVRIEQAQHLLSEGAPLALVAHDTGFADQAHFSRCFRQANGLTPGQWTRRYVSSNS